MSDAADFAAADRRRLLVFMALAVSARFALALYFGDRVTARPGAADEVSYDALAQRVAAGYGFSFPRAWYPFTAAGEPTAHWSFLYTSGLAALYAAFGHHPLLPRLLQVALSIAVLRSTYRIGASLFDRRVGLVAAALSSCYAYFAFFSAVLMTQTAFIVAVLVAMDRALRLSRSSNGGGWTGLGVVLGIGVLLRQTLLLFAPFLLLWVGWQRGFRASLRGMATAAFCIALLVLPWAVRNYRAFGDFLLLNSNGGFFLYASNHPDQGVDFDPSFVPALPPEIRRLDEPAADRALMRGALEFIRRDPLRFLRLSASRVGDYFWIGPSRRSSWVSNLGRLASFTLYLPFMLYGLWLSRGRAARCAPLYAYIAFEAALHLCSWASPRYRLPSDALAMVFAALAVLALAARAGWVAPAGAAPEPAEAS